MEPKCGFCDKQLKQFKSCSVHGVTLYCCSECGAVLGITRDLDFTVYNCEDIKDDEKNTNNDKKEN